MPKNLASIAFFFFFFFIAHVTCDVQSYTYSVHHPVIKRSRVYTEIAKQYDSNLITIFFYEI